MPYSYNKFPASLTHLSTEERNKAIEIANTLIEEGYEDQIAVSIAISNARQWASYCFKEGLEGKQNINVHLIPNPKGWALISADANPIFICSTKSEALSRARLQAKNEKLKLFIHSDEGKIQDVESFMVNLPNVESKTFDEEKFLIDKGRNENMENIRSIPKRRHSQLIFQPKAR